MSNSQIVGQAGVVDVSQAHSEEWHWIGFDQAIRNPVVVLMINTRNGTQPVTLRADSVSDTGFYFQIDEWEYLDGSHTVETISWMAVSEGIHTLEDGTKIVAENITVDDSFSEVGFDTGYDGSFSFSSTPVVLAQTVTTNDEHAVTTRLRRIDTDSVEIKLQGEEADRGHSAPETVSLIAIEAGASATAGTTGDTVRHDSYQITFDNAVSGDVVFFAQMQTTDGGDTATVRAEYVDGSGATVFVEEEESSDSETGHTTEEVGYFALQAGSLLSTMSMALEGDSSGAAYFDELFGGTEDVDDLGSGWATNFAGNDRSMIDWETGFHVEHDTLVANKKNAVLEFLPATLKGDGGHLSFLIAGEGGGFESAQESHTDWFKVLIDTGSGWQVLDTFHTIHGTQTFKGDQSGQEFGSSLTTLSYDIPAGATEVKLRLEAHSTATSEVFRMDDFSILDVVAGAGDPAPEPVEASDGGTDPVDPAVDAVDDGPFIGQEGTTLTGNILENDIGAGSIVSITLEDGTTVGVGETFTIALTNGEDTITAEATVAADGTLTVNTTGDPAANAFFEGDAPVIASFSYTLEGAAASTVKETITFDEGTLGEGSSAADINAALAAKGVTVETYRRQDLNSDWSLEPGAPLATRIYDTSTFGQDNDLMASTDGTLDNVLIIQEDNGTDLRADDNAQGGKFVITFDGPTTVHSVDLIDTEEKNDWKPDWLVTYWDGTTEIIKASVTGNQEATTQVFNGDTGLVGVKSLALHVIGSAAIDNIVIGKPGPKATDTAAVTVKLNPVGQPAQEEPTDPVDPVDPKDPGVVVEVQRDGYGIFESEDVTGANVIDGDTLARTISYQPLGETVPQDFAFTGGVQDGTDAGQLTLVSFAAGGDEDADGFVATVEGDLVTVSNGTETYTGTVSLDADGNFQFLTGGGFDALEEGEVVTFQLDYTVSAPGGPAGNLIDLSGFALGDVLTNQIPGVTITATGGSGDAMIFDSSNPNGATGGDTDLMVGFGNLLIISEDGDSSDPDDNAGGGTLDFAFDAPQTLESITFVDTEEHVLPILHLYYEDGRAPITIPGLATGDGGNAALFFDSVAGVPDGYNSGVSRLVVELPGSGAIKTIFGSPTAVTETSTIDVSVFGEGGGDGGSEPDPTGAISGKAFDDIDRDGQFEQAADETPRAGVTVRLLDADGNAVVDASGAEVTTVTAQDGSYSFSGLADGTYQVEFAAQDGREFTEANIGDDATDSDADPLTGRATAAVEGGGTTPNVDAGYIVPTGTISGITFNDTDRDGQFEADAGETVRSGVTVELLDGDQVIEVAVTGQNGAYSFSGLEAGDYTVRFGEPAGVDFTLQDEGDDTTDSDADPVTGEAAVTVAPGQITADVDAGYIVPTGTVDGRVFLDEDGDGIQDAGEPGIEGATVTLKDESGTPVATTTTDRDGNYVFDDVEGGTYTIEVDNPSDDDTDPTNDLEFTTQDAGDDDSVDSDVDETGSSGSFTLDPGASETVDAGLRELAVITGEVFLDTDRDGLDGAADTPIAGVTVELVDAGGTAIATTTSDAAGVYTFTNVDAGDYTVRFTNPGGGLSFTTPNVDDPANDDTNDSDAVSADDLTGEVAVSVGFGDRLENVDAGFQAPRGAIDGSVFLDADGDGIRDAGEGQPTDGAGAPVEVLVELLDETGAVIGSQTTTDGTYLFDDLGEGDYRVRVANPPELDAEFTVQDAGTDDSVDSDVDATGTSDLVTVSAGETETVDAGYRELSVITGEVFLDNDRDGVDGIGDEAVAGVTVELLDTSGTVVDSTTSLADGTYVFTDVMAGDYEVRFTNPNQDPMTGFEFTTPDVGTDDTVDSDAAPNGDGTGSANVSVGFGQRLENVDAGFVQPDIALSINGRLDTDPFQRQSVVLILDISARALEVDAFPGATGKFGVGTPLDAYLDEVLLFAKSLVDQGRGNAEITVVFNTAFEENLDVPVNAVSQTWRADQIVEVDADGDVVMDANGLPAKGAGAIEIFDSAPDTPSTDRENDTIDVGASLQTAAGLLAQAGSAEDKQVVMITSSTGYSEALNRSGNVDTDGREIEDNTNDGGGTAPLTSLGNGDSLVEGKASLFQNPFSGPEAGQLSGGLVDVRLDGLSSDGKLISYSGFFLRGYRADGTTFDDTQVDLGGKFEEIVNLALFEQDAGGNTVLRTDGALAAYVQRRMDEGSTEEEVVSELLSTARVFDPGISDPAGFNQGQDGIGYVQVSVSDPAPDGLGSGPVLLTADGEVLGEEATVDRGTNGVDFNKFFGGGFSTSEAAFGVIRLFPNGDSGATEYWVLDPTVNLAQAAAGYGIDVSELKIVDPKLVYDAPVNASGEVVIPEVKLIDPTDYPSLTSATPGIGDGAGTAVVTVTDASDPEKDIAVDSDGDGVTDVETDFEVLFVDPDAGDVEDRPVLQINGNDFLEFGQIVGDLAGLADAQIPIEDTAPFGLENLVDAVDVLEDLVDFSVVSVDTETGDEVELFDETDLVDDGDGTFSLPDTQITVGPEVDAIRVSFTIDVEGTQESFSFTDDDLSDGVSFARGDFV